MAIISKKEIRYSFDYQPSDEDYAFMQKCGFREPPHPYVVFRGKRIEIFGNEKRTKSNLTAAQLLKREESDVFLLDESANERFVYEDISIMNVAGAHKQTHKIDHMLRKKGFKIICWGKFPPAHSHQAKMLTDGPDKPSPWTILDAYLRTCVGEEIGRSQREKVMAQEIAAEKQKRMALEAEIEALRKKGKAA